VAAFVFEEAFTVPTLIRVTAFAMGFTSFGILTERLLPFLRKNLRGTHAKGDLRVFGAGD
jgi:hypothetical protein